MLLFCDIYIFDSAEPISVFFSNEISQLAGKPVLVSRPIVSFTKAGVRDGLFPL